ncbi:MAG: 2-polyprenylphenol 6-hydroxylase [Pseudomonadota bacterium]
MRGPHNILRLARTGATFERSGAMRTALEKLEVPPNVRIAARILGWPFKWLGLRGDPNQPPVVRAITALGPAYIKFGQLLSTRPDVVGPDMAVELRVLQDKLPPFPTAQAKKIIEDEIGRPIDQIFSRFDEPIAAASIAQVHKATLAATGDQVAVKVIRPNIEAAFRRDIDAFYFAASMIELISPATRRLKPSDVVGHFDATCKGELDLRMEAAGASQYYDNTRQDQGFRVPKIFWNNSSKSVLTMEWIDGVSFGDLDALQATGQDLNELGKRLLTKFLKHALRDGYFHADLHQGNLKLAPNGDLVALDFGIMGRIDEYTRRVYAGILMGFIQRDYRRVAELHFEAGYVPADRNIDDFAQALRSVGEPIFGQDASQISMARLLAHLFDVTERFGMETRLELILLQRTMVVVEGVSRYLNPHLNIWEVAQPVVEDYIRTYLGPRAIARDLRITAEVISRFGPRLPEIVENLLEKGLEKPTKPRARRLRMLPAIGWSIAGAVIASGLWALSFLF